MPRFKGARTTVLVLSASIATAAWAQAPVLVGGSIKEPRKLIDVAPVYPAIAKQAKVEGSVILEATIDRDGRVTDARVLRSQPLFEAAAVEAVRQWRYEPTVIGGTPTEVLMTITLNFVLKEPVPIELATLLDQAKSAREAGRFAEAEQLLQRALDAVRQEASSLVLSRPSAPAETAPLRIGGAIKQPRRLTYVEPVYPANAKTPGVEGLVVIDATIGIDGRVTNQRILRSNPLFDQAALDAVARWTYEPTTLNGVPVAVLMTVTISFKTK